MYQSTTADSFSNSEPINNDLVTNQSTLESE